MLLLLTACTLITDHAIDVKVGVSGADSVPFDTSTNGDTGYHTGDDTGAPGDTGSGVIDGDGDGYTVGEGDCDDSNPEVHPGGTEICGDGLDDDCDGSADQCELTSRSLSAADAEFDGQAADDEAGYALSGAGDVNGDGLADILVGAYGNGSRKGATYLVFGSSLPVSGALASANAVFVGISAGDESGASVAGVGDVDGDGYDDMLVGAPGTAENAGAAYFLRGSAAPPSCTLASAGAVFTGETGDDAGYFVASAGDVNGDSTPDLLVGALRPGTTSAGSAYVIFGGGEPASAPLSSADAVFSGEHSNDGVGSALASAGDVDGDGFDDVVVGAYGAGSDMAGAAYILLGGSSVLSGSLNLADAVYAGAPEDEAGRGVSSAGDYNGDGYADVIIGAYNNGDAASAAGAVFLVLGGPRPLSEPLTDADAEWTGVDANDEAGTAVSSAGDVDGDGFDDVLVGAPHNGDGGDAAGAAYLILGSATPASGSLAHAQAEFRGPEAGDFAGAAVAGAGDTNGDGAPDLLVGAFGVRSSAGSAYLILGMGL